MVIKIYISGSSGNKEVKKRQQRVLLILDSKNVTYEVIDIAEPGAEEAKDFMQNTSTSLGATIGDPSPRHALPPQIFNDDAYCGDYDMFDMANEIDEMETFLKLEPNSLSEKIFAPEPKLKNGDLSIDEKIDKVAGGKADDEETKENEVPNEQEKDENKKEGSVEKEENKKEGSVEKEDNKKEGSVEKEADKKEGSVEKEADKKEGSVEKEADKKEGSVEKEENKKEGSAEKEDDKKEGSVEIEDKDKPEKDENSEKKEIDEDSGAEGDKADDDEDDKKNIEDKEELEKEASPEKSE